MQRTKNYYIYFCIIKKGTFQVKYFYILRMCCFFVPLHIEAVKVIIQSRFPKTYKQKERRAKLLKTKNKKKTIDWPQQRKACPLHQSALLNHG